ncbi:uncharacterized protein MELLADRAFT_65220 [Melampsora larici-populina 98AG31]|uniref:Uncharacterized protein n=1 Tax=Melampsora larici-populina (strain 98AG31 / pathotype 3-4-7) TaxID=747676 RepID=F4RUF8_MELLP|nr:uncharacterized protein MELLADRAFT_65220 [Melampsora larici-populina 98AG31]EGG04005.1 hypothetical protein MELLADRAFT_65220 [Melampsora larici-populina 98AG31]
MDPVPPANNHGIYLSGNFEIHDKIPPTKSSETGGIYTLSIGCSGVHRDNTGLHHIQAYSLGPADDPVYVKGVYFLRGPFFPKNLADTTFDSLIFEGQDHPFVGTALSYMGNFIDSVAVTSTGIVCRIDSIRESSPQNLDETPYPTDDVTKVVTVLHRDYHPILKTSVESKVEYWIRPSVKLIGLSQEIVLGRQYQLHGFIKDFNEHTNAYIIVANRIYAMTPPLTNTATSPSCTPTTQNCEDVEGSNNMVTLCTSNTKLTSPSASNPCARVMGTQHNKLMVANQIFTSTSNKRPRPNSM